MNYEHYQNISISTDYHVYDFISTGINGDIEKRIVFQPLQGNLVFNLAFGDKKGDSIDDYSISDNKDMPKILSTVAAAVELFLTVYPERYIYCRGSTAERTRLYRMAIGNNLSHLSQLYKIWGITEEGLPIPFAQNGPYTGFLIQKKLLNL